jgi:hypothetical protein
MSLMGQKLPRNLIKTAAALPPKADADPRTEGL